MRGHKLKAFSGNDNVRDDFELDLESHNLSENLSDRRLKWPDYNLRPKFISFLYSVDNYTPPKNNISPSMLNRKPVFDYPLPKNLEGELPTNFMETDNKTTFTNHDSKNVEKRHTSSKKGTGTDALTTASPSKSPTRAVVDSPPIKVKQKVSKNPFQKEKDTAKQNHTCQTSNSRSKRYKNAIEGWEAPQQDYKFPPSNPKVATFGDIKLEVADHNFDSISKGKMATSLYNIKTNLSQKK